MKDRDILKTVVAVNAAADLHAIRAHLDKQEEAAKAARLQAAHQDVVASLDRHYEFITRELHKKFLVQQRSGRTSFVIWCFAHHFIAGLISLFVIIIAAKLFGETEAWFPWFLGVLALGYMGYATRGISRWCRGVYFMFHKIWTGDPQHDLENVDVRQLAEKFLAQQARANAGFAFQLHNIAQRDPNWELSQMARFIA